MIQSNILLKLLTQEQMNSKVETDLKWRKFVGTVI